MLGYTNLTRTWEVTMLASFNYQGPPTVAVVIGAGLAIAIIVALQFSRSVLAGLFGGAISWGLIAFVVLGKGSGDMTELIQMFYGAIFGLAGAFVGMASSKATRRRGRVMSGCRHCGYNITGYESGVCRKCGKPISAS